MKESVVKALGFLKISKKELEDLIEIPRNQEMGDYAFPCFTLAKKYKKNPIEICKDIAGKIKSKHFEKVVSAGPYVNFFVSKDLLARSVLGRISKEKDKYGSSKAGKNKVIVVESSSPNIAKPFGIGHLRSTIIGNAIGNIAEFQGYNVKRINYLGDWGTQFGKLIAGYKKKGKIAELKKDPIKYMLKLYIEGNKEEYADSAREWFKKLESGDSEAKKLWKLFRDLSLKDFSKTYNKLGIKFDVLSGESFYNNKMSAVVKTLERRKLLKKDQGAEIVDLKEHGLGVSLIKKSDGATLYVTRDLAAAIERKKKYGFSKMIYEVGREQGLHFRQLFKILELMGYKWAKDCVHVDHGLYLGSDGKRFRTRAGGNIWMEDVLESTIEIAKNEIKKRQKVSAKELEARAKKIAISAIFYGDLKNHRTNDVVFNLKHFLSFDGDTGPYLLYSYARSQSILKKAKYKPGKLKIKDVSSDEKKLVSMLGKFPDVVKKAYDNLTPNVIANYSYGLSKAFSEFYHEVKVLGSDREDFRLRLVGAFSQTLKNSLNLLGIDVVDRM